MQQHHLRVVAQHRGAFLLSDNSPARLAGALRHAGRRPVVGDWVEVHDGTIVGLAPRRGGVIARGGDAVPLAANVDSAWIVTSLGRDVNPRRVERYLALAAAGRTDPVVILNKADLDPDPPLHDSLGCLRAVAPGVPVVPVSARTGQGIEVLETLLPAGRTVVLLGSSGVGKSTLTNRLLGEGRQATNEVRVGDSRGRHTTTRRELVELPGGGALIDTPGLRAVPVTEDAVTSGAFPDIDELATRCRFGDCSHTTEPGCEVRGRVAPDRLASYLALTAEADRELATRRKKERAGRIGARALRQLYRERGRR